MAKALADGHATFWLDDQNTRIRGPHEQLKGWAMKLTSPAFDDGQTIPARYTCDGENVSPELQWSDVPEGTLTLALTCVIRMHRGGPSRTG